MSSGAVWAKPAASEAAVNPGEADEEDSAPAEDVGEAPGGQQQHHVGQDVAVDDPAVLARSRLKSRWMVGSATLTIELSSAVTKTPSATTLSVSHRCSEGREFVLVRPNSEAFRLFR
jgi:hypothetical protein